MGGGERREKTTLGNILCKSLVREHGSGRNEPTGSARAEQYLVPTPGLVFYQGKAVFGAIFIAGVGRKAERNLIKNNDICQGCT